MRQERELSEYINVHQEDTENIQNISSEKSTEHVQAIYLGNMQLFILRILSVAKQEDEIDHKYPEWPSNYMNCRYTKIV